MLFLIITAYDIDFVLLFNSNVLGNCVISEKHLFYCNSSEELYLY